MATVRIVLISLVLCGCFSRATVVSRQSFDDITIGTSVAEVEQKIGSPYAVQKLPKGAQEYEYIERIYMGEEVIEERHYYLKIQDGHVVSKRLSGERQPAYDLIYDDDPNDTDLQ